MNFPHHGYRPEEPQQSAEATWEEHPPVAHDAPTLRAEEFDPVWVAETEAQQREAMTQHDLDRLEEIITSEHFRTRRPRSPNYVPPPPQPLARRRGGLKWTVGTFTALVVSSSLIALYTTGRLPLPEEWQQGVANQGTRLASLVTPESQSQTPTRAAEYSKPRLVVNGANAENNEEILIGVTVESPRDGATGVISGLAQGTTLSSGKPWGSTGWTLPASELATTYLRPPAGFTGVMEYTVALQLADGTIADRQTMRLEWDCVYGRASAASSAVALACSRASAESCAVARAGVAAIAGTRPDARARHAVRTFDGPGGGCRHGEAWRGIVEHRRHRQRASASASRGGST